MDHLDVVRYKFEVGLAWCPRSRQPRVLTISFTHMAKIIEINKVPMTILLHINIKELKIGKPACYSYYVTRLNPMQYRAMID